MIKEAAIMKDGVVYTGRRHNNILCDKSRPFAFLRDGEQGFVTDEGKFVTREEALVIALQCGQVTMDKKHNPQDQLLSEDLY